VKTATADEVLFQLLPTLHYMWNLTYNKLYKGFQSAKPINQIFYVISRFGLQGRIPNQISRMKE